MSPMDESPAPAPRVILAVVAFGVFVAADDLTVVSTMLRQIIFDLEIPLPEGLDQAAWIVNAYLIAYVAIMPFIGRLSDIVGRRAVYVGALALFLVGSIWVPFARDLSSFIVGRVLTALGGGAMVPVAMAVVGDVYQPQERATAMGTLGAVDTAGWVWGPFYGALLINIVNWRWQFYLNIPLSLVGIVAAWWALSDLPQPKTRVRIDWLGSAILAAGIISLNIALLGSGDIQSAGSFGEAADLSQPMTLPLFILAAASFLAFVFVQHRLDRRTTDYDVDGTCGGRAPFRSLLQAPPLISMTLFRRVNFTPAVFINFIVGGTLIISMVNVPLIVNVLEFDVEKAALTSGLLLSGMTISMALSTYVGGRLTQRVSYRPVTATGLSLCVVGFIMMGRLWVVDIPYGQMASHLVILGLGFGLVTAPVGTAVINAAPTTQRGVAAGLVIVMRLLGMSVGLSGLTAWGLRRFDLLRTRIELPNLPLSDPIYQQALIDGLVGVTLRVLTETFLVSSGVAVLALIVSLRMRPDRNE